MTALNRKYLFIFNLSMDLDNPILATSNLWVNEMAKKFDCVYVYTTHAGRYKVGSNTTVYELGGGTLIRKIKAIMKISLIIPILFRFRKVSAVFHHQSPRTAVYPGLFIRFFSIPQCIWYSHSSKPISLILSRLIANRVFSSSVESFPIPTRKMFPLGHGIDVEAAGEAFLIAPKKRSGVIFAGRINPIKNLGDCIEAIGKSALREKSFDLIGPLQSNSIYLEELKRLAAEKKVNLSLERPIPHDLIFQRMSSARIFYAGMKNSVDKSCLEAAATGCFILTSDEASSRLSGMDLIWELITGSRKLPDLPTQIDLLEKLSEQNESNYRILIHKKASEMNSSFKIAAKISQFLQTYGA